MGTAKRLLAAKATPNLPNLLGQTPLMYAAGFGTEELTLLLLSALKTSEGRKAVDSQGRYKVVIVAMTLPLTIGRGYASRSPCMP